MPASLTDVNAPATVYDLLTRAKTLLEAATELRASEVLWGNRTEPAPLLHRQFRLDPSGDVNTGELRAKPGQHIRLEEQFVVHVTHDFEPHNSDKTVRVAIADATNVVESMLTRLELNREFLVTYKSCKRKQAGNFVETDLVFGLRYNLDLPESA